MSEAGWIQVITLVLAAFSPIILVWARGKFDNVTKKIADVHTELNSRLDQWKREMKAGVDAAETAALARGVAEGIEIERNRTAALRNILAKEVLHTAQDVAKEVIQTAKEEKEKS